MSLPCPTGKIRNPKTGRCVKIDGKIGRSLLKSAAPKKQSPPKKSPQKQDSLEMVVQDVASVTGTGTVALCTILNGQVNIGESVFIIGFGETKYSIITGMLNLNKQPIHKAGKGESVSVVLRGVMKKDVHKGALISNTNLKPIEQFKAALNVLLPIKTGYTVSVIVPNRFIKVTGEINLENSTVAQPGSKPLVLIKLMKPVYLPIGTLFELHESKKMIGDGRRTA